MGSRRFFYFLPLCGCRLDFQRAIRAILEEGFTFASSAFVTIQDECGVLLSADERLLESPAGEHLSRMLRAGEDLEVFCGDASLGLTCSFGSPHEDPLFSINVSRKTWFRLDAPARTQYMRGLIRIAGKSSAAYILVVDDPADDFLSHLEPVDDEWMIDLSLSDGTEYDPLSVWVGSKVGTLPGMRKLRATGQVLDEYEEYEEDLA